MSRIIEAVILTKSTKNGGYCVAGIDVKTSQWVRFVSNDVTSHGALFNKDVQYEDGSYCEILDVVSIPILDNVPSEHQPENVLIDNRNCWGKTGKSSISELLKLHPLEHHRLLLGNKYAYITEEKISTVNHSLILISVNNLVITHPYERSTKATFDYNFDTYEKMSITDPVLYNTQDQTKIGDAILVISLPDVPYKERRYYKFIAQIFPISYRL